MIERSFMTWFLAEPAEGILLQAEEDGLWLRSETIDFGNSANFATSIAPKTRLGRFLPTLVPQLLEMGLATIEETGVRIAYDDFVTFEDQDIVAFDSIVPYAPFLIDLRTSGIPGRGNFLYQLRYFWGNQQVFLDRLGCFVKRNDKVFRLDPQSYELAEAVKKFNELPANKKELPDAFIDFAKIKGISEDIGASIESFIQKFRVVITPSIGLDFITEGEDRISFVPKIDIEGISQESLHRVFLLSADPTDLSIQTPDGELVKIVFNEEQKEVLRRMQSVRKFGGKERADVLRNPQKVFEGVAGAVNIDSNIFGARVKGIGDFPFVSRITLQYSGTGVFVDPDIEGDTKPAPKKLDVAIVCIVADGSEEKVVFDTRKALLSFQSNVRAAIQNGEGTVKLNEKTLVIDKSFAEGIDAVVDRVTKKKINRGESEKAQRLYLLIYENEETREYVEGKERKSISEADYFLPKSIISESVLKKYQKEGVRWLQQNYLLKRGGCLLADDMGLGKTLQVLTFLAWLIERGDISPDRARTEESPWNPILIVAPIILLESETWVNDMKTFFKNEGAIFIPHIPLHGDKLKAYRKAGIAGSETSIGESVLDLDKLKGFRVIFTNYETVVNYQFSFAMMKSSWSVVVTDEAQEYKTPKTKVSHALKSLAPSFRIACTGTPVETRLLDVWNIFDFLQPGSLLGSLREFSEEIVRPYDDPSVNCKDVLDRLRKKLNPAPNRPMTPPVPFILRRDKTTELEGLPLKHEHKIYCALSVEQREMHIDFVKRGRTGGEGNHPFSLIQQLMRLYQHPALIPRYEPFSINQIDEVLSKCPKLAKLIDILKGIRNKREKVLIFTRSTEMQQLLAASINTVFGLRVDIVNGASPRKGNTRAGLNTRNEMLSRFRATEGFSVIILSPDVAGVGLTLVEANHIIHYGRWWNPAKESQATDRAYRIGQVKDVNVYYLIARDPQNAFKTFDEKLDALIQRRYQMAADFLAPLPAEDEMGKELCGDIFSDEVVGEPVRSMTAEDVRKLPWDRFEALVALLEEKQGRKSLLTPRSGDRGIDVISVQGNTLRLIQCKHTLWEADIETDVIAETINGFDNYRGTLLRDIAANYSMVPILVTNGKCSRSTLRYAQEKDVQIISAMEFEQSLKQHLCTHAEIENIDNGRLSSLVEVKKRVAILLTYIDN